MLKPLVRLATDARWARIHIRNATVLQASSFDGMVTSHPIAGRTFHSLAFELPRPETSGKPQSFFLSNKTFTRYVSTHSPRSDASQLKTRHSTSATDPADIRHSALLAKSNVLLPRIAAQVLPPGQETPGHLTAPRISGDHRPNASGPVTHRPRGDLGCLTVPVNHPRSPLSGAGGGGWGHHSPITSLLPRLEAHVNTPRLQGTLPTTPTSFLPQRHALGATWQSPVDQEWRSLQTTAVCRHQTPGASPEPPQAQAQAHAQGQTQGQAQGQAISQGQGQREAPRHPPKVPQHPPHSPQRQQQGRSRAEQQREASRTQLMYLVALVIAMVGTTYAAVPLYRMFCQATGYGGTTQRKEGVEQKLGRRPDEASGSRGGPGSASVDPELARQEEVARAAARRQVVIYFNADVADGLPWKFTPCQKELRLKPGQSTLAFYTAHNRSEEAITGVSTYNVSPMKAGIYFNKIQCFCFEEQRLQPGEKIDMPVFFYIDPEFAVDPNMDDITNLTLSYTFFKVNS